MSGDQFTSLRRTMVSNQLRPAGVVDVAVLAAMDEIARERFVGAGHAALCYRDTVVPLGDGRGLNPPIATGRLLDAARVQPGDHVLVVGAGTGYVAAVLARIGARVVALESDAALADRARSLLGGSPNVAVVEGPLAAGWAAEAPYDLIYVDGGVERVPEALVAQVGEGGRLVAAIVERGVSRLVSGRRTSAGLGTVDFADVETARLPGFAPEPAFTF